VARLFVALPIPDAVVDDLVAMQGGVPGAHWVPAENFHLTLCFLGEVHGAHRRDVEDVLETVDAPAFELTLGGIDAFADKGRPRALYVAAQKCEALDHLQVKVANALRGAGVALERRRFQPHVTLARFETKSDFGHHLAQFAASHNLWRSGSFDVERFVLYASHLRSGAAPMYLEAASYPLRTYGGEVEDDQA
jgi:2'-5' RNA ligase